MAALARLDGGGTRRVFQRRDQALVALSPKCAADRREVVAVNGSS